jgi:hydroxymethylglutaryl-CoA synthase
LQKNFEPKGEVSTLTPGTYYLEKVDDMFKRFYAIKE